MTTQPEETRQPRPRRLRRLLRHAGIGVLVLLVVAVVARRQIGNALAKQLNAQLAAAGIHASWGAVDFTVGPVLQLHDVALYRDPAKTDRIALLGNVTVRKGDAGWKQWTTANIQVADSRLILASGELETTLEHLNLDLNVRPGTIDLRAFDANLQGLRVEASAHVVPAASTEAAAPTASKPLESLDLSWLQQVKEWVDFQPQATAPVLRVDYRSRDDGSVADVTITFDGRTFGWRGQQWDALQLSATTTLGGPPAPVVVDSLHVGHAGKSADITASYDTTQGVVHVDKLDSSLDLLALARAFSPDQGTGLAGLSATGDWQLQGSGPISIGQPSTSDWKGRLALDGDLTYAKEATRVTLSNPACDLAWVASTLTIGNFTSGLWGGGLTMPDTRIQLPEGEAPARFDTVVRLTGASLEAVMASFGTAQKQPGTLDVDWTGGGTFSLPDIKGGGSLAIDGAEFFRIPLLGPLHLVFDQISPGFGKDVASSLTCKHTLADSTLAIQQLHLDSKLTRIDANGTIDLESNDAALAAKAKLQGMAGKATALVSSLLEVEGRGPVSDMRWGLKNLPSTEMISDAAKNVGKAGETVIDGTGKALKSTGKAVKGLLSAPGKLLPKK